MEIFMKSAVRQSELGLGDGTVYASGTIADADISQANSTFTLTGFTLDALTGTDTDDLMNGYLLYFPVSGNKYHVVDWVAATDTATTHEMPQITDTGACEFRRALFDNKALASNPLIYAADGRKNIKWKSGLNTIIDVYLPNLIKDGGFESGSLAPWEKFTAGGTADTTGINTASPILGANDLKMDIGDRTSVIIEQKTILPIQKDRTYRILFKARSATSFVSGSLEASFIKRGRFDVIPVIFTSQSSGTVTSIKWLPEITSSNAWHSVDFKSSDAYPPGVSFRLNIIAGASILNIDEVFIYEAINVNSIILFGLGTSNNINKIIGNRCAPDRQGFIATIDDFTMANSLQSAKGEVADYEFTPGVFPVYSIDCNRSIPLNESSEIMLSEKWSWQFNPDMPFDAESIDYDERTIKTRSGVESIIRHSKKRKVKGRYSKMSAVERAILKNDFFPHHIDEERHPFAYRLNATDSPLFVRVSQSKFGLSRSSGIRDDWDFAFDEVL